MGIRVKICGITAEDALEAAISAGAAYVGFVFFPRSPRNISLDAAARLAKKARGRVETVALVVDATDSEIAAIMSAVQPDFLQLHGSETPERVAAIKELSGAQIIKAVKVASAGDVEAAREFEDVAGILLFDAKAVGLPGALPGGNGVPFEWTLLKRQGLRPNFMLSGGLSPDNVLDAIMASGARAVDVSSGVEIAPGVKSPERIRSFIERAKPFDPVQAGYQQAV